MRCKILIFIGILALGGGVFSLTQEQDDHRKTEKLLRTDLLNFESAPLKESRRNIFIPSPGDESFRGQEHTAGRPEISVLPGDLESLEEERAGTSLLPRIDLRYIGYVGNKERKVALLLHGGEALAVQTEDILPDGVKIIRIAEEEIEVELPGGENVKFFLEGEKE